MKQANRKSFTGTHRAGTASRAAIMRRTENERAFRHKYPTETSLTHHNWRE